MIKDLFLVRHLKVSFLVVLFLKMSEFGVIQTTCEIDSFFQFFDFWSLLVIS